MSAASRGHAAERRAKKMLENEGWFVFRAPASLGDCDLVALKRRRTPMLIEVKANHGNPYQNFRWRDRADLLEAAAMAGAEAWLLHLEPRKAPRWIPSSEWPEAKAGVVA